MRLQSKSVTLSWCGSMTHSTGSSQTCFNTITPPVSTKLTVVANGKKVALAAAKAITTCARKRLR